MSSYQSLFPIAPIAALAIAFLLGSIPFGMIVARLFHVKDLSREGSGNIGATNVTRVLGFWPAGALTFGLDVLKGALPVLLAGPVGSKLWTIALGMDGFEFDESLVWGMGLAAVLGHCFSPWLYFKGGKGVATGFGALLVLSPVAALFGIIGFAMTFLTRRLGSLASLTGLVVAAVVHLVIHEPGTYLWVGAGILFVIIQRHSKNIEALLSDQEYQFKNQAE